MKTTPRPMDQGLIRIFRFFSGATAVVFLFLQVLPGPFRSTDPIDRRVMLLFSVTYGFIFLYLMIPGLKDRLRGFYMPPVLLAASIIPIAIINAKYRSLSAAGVSISTLDDTMTVTILLIFPLIITAWQYRFPLVFLFYVILGFLDPLLIILVNETFTPEIYGAFNASLVRILALSAVGFIITELRGQQRREQQALEEANRKLEDYAIASERLAASRERNRIARDLHDTLAHTLSGLAIQLEAIDTLIDDESTQVKTMISNSRSTVRDGLGETRRALQALRTVPLEDLGLTMALQRLSDNAAARSSAAVHTELPMEIPDWNENLEEVTYRIAQEALENIVRHAHAGYASVTLFGDEGRLELRVADDGEGFDARKHRESHFGLRGMRERAAAVGGTLTVNSNKNRGTEILFRWAAAPG